MKKENIVIKAQELAKKVSPLINDLPQHSIIAATIDMADWVLANVWKDASEESQNLPELEKEVIVLVNGLYPKIAKRTKHIIEDIIDEDTGEIITVETNELGEVEQWNMHDITHWLDIELPKIK